MDKVPPVMPVIVNKIGRHLSPAEKSRQEQAVNGLYLKGMPQAVIAEQLGISQTTVSRCLKRVADYCRKIYSAEFKEILNRELQKLDHLELEAWKGWEKSCKDAARQTVKAVRSGTEAIPVEKTLVTEGQSGDPRFLQIVNDCISKRCDLLGVEAPKKIDLVKPVIPNVYVIDAESKGFLDRILAGEERPADPVQPPAVPPQ